MNSEHNTQGILLRCHPANAMDGLESKAAGLLMLHHVRDWDVWGISAAAAAAATAATATAAAAATATAAHVAVAVVVAPAPAPPAAHAAGDGGRHLL